MPRHKRLSKKYTPLLIAVGLPASLKMIAEYMQQLIDMIYIGQYNTNSFVAISSIIMPLAVVESIWWGLTSANTVMISQRLGAKKDKEASTVAHRMFMIGGIFSVLFFTFWQTCAPVVIQMMNLTGDTATEAINYLRTYSYLYLFRFVFVGAPSSALIALGKTKQIMWATIAQSLTNIALNPIFIWGVEGLVPEFGLRGAAFGTVSAELICAFMISSYFIKHNFLNLKEVKIAFNNFFIKERLIYGMPITIEIMFWAFASALIISMLNDKIYLGAAIFTIGFQLSDVCYKALYGFDLANMSLVGKAFGGKRKDRAIASIKSSLNLKLIFGGILFITIFLFQEQLTRFFTTDEYIIQQTLDNFFWILAVSALIITVGLNMSTMNGMGYARYSLYISIVGISLRIIISWWVLYHTNFGITGVWIASFTEESLRLLCTYLVRKFLIAKRWPA
ncbi:MAG: MATE family efflux transporter [Brevinema sp.]